MRRSSIKKGWEGVTKLADLKYKTSCLFVACWWEAAIE